MEEKKTPRWRWGVNRWFVLLFIILSFLAWRAYPPIAPHIQLPAEPLTEPLFQIAGQDFYLTNTLVATFLADLVLLLIGFAVWRATRGGNLVPRGISGAVEALLEALYNLTQSSAGKWAKTIFPWFATITLLVLIANWTELIPGVDSIGILEHPHAEGVHGFPTQELIPGMDTIVPGEAEGGEGFQLIPFVRTASTDLNFTLALALISVVMTQVIGIRALGLSYFTKFLNVRTLFKVPVFGVIDFVVGILEMVSEFSKVLSFTFRLFGNIFAGSVLLFVIGSLVPVFAQSGFLMLEFFVGLIQAIVFGLLTMVFMSMAVVSHHPDEHAEAH